MKNGKLTRFVGKIKFTAMQHKSEIWFVGGTVAVIGGAVAVGKATLKAKDIFDDADAQMDIIDNATELETDEYTEEDRKKDIRIVKLQTGAALVKCYAIPTILIAGGIFCFAKGQANLKKINVGLSTLLAKRENDFDTYRQNVRDRFGDQVDWELKNGVVPEEIEVIETDEKGKNKKVTRTVYNSSNFSVDTFTRVYDDGNTGWCKDPELNKEFLIAREKEANWKLQKQGYLFFNDVLNMLGFTPVAEGQIAGWIYNADDDDTLHQVDFGLGNPDNARFLNCDERNAVLQFNCEDNILTRM